MDSQGQSLRVLATGLASIRPSIFAMKSAGSCGVSAYLRRKASRRSVSLYVLFIVNS